MNSLELRWKFLDFFEKHGHKIVPSSSLLPSDHSVLFTTAGMQQFKPYYLGEKSPWGPNVASCQKCIRTSDIEEVGDERHLTFFEMLGNFSFGGYFKEKAIELAHKFIIEELKLDIDYVTVFSPDKVADGDWRKGVAEDAESYEIWKKYVPESKIRKEGADNFWGPTGGEGPCGPTTEIYVNGIEIWNIVFNEFFLPMISHAMGEHESYSDFEKRLNKEKLEKLEKLETPGVDTGMGLERLAIVVQKVLTVFETDLFESLIKLIPDGFEENKKRIIVDHTRAIVFLISDGVRPSNKEQGYILRRLIRRVIAYEHLSKKIFLKELLKKVFNEYNKVYHELNLEVINKEFLKEKEIFSKALTEGLDILEKKLKWPEGTILEKTYKTILKDKDLTISGKEAFYLYNTHALPLEIIKEIARERGFLVDESGFHDALREHQELSRTASAGIFKGGLVDHELQTIKLHTAHHLLLAALQEMFGKEVKQKGSNINQKRLRIDFSFDRKLTDKEKKKLENVVQSKIDEGLEVIKKEMPLEEAQKIGAEMEFGVKYGNTVSVYFIKDKKGGVFSKEFCGGPHIKNTSELGRFKIIKEEAVSSGVRRIKAILE